LNIYNAIMLANREEDLQNCAKHVESLWSMAPNTPQQNRVMEWKIAIDYDCVYAMLLAAGLKQNL